MGITVYQCAPKCVNVLLVSNYYIILILLRREKTAPTLKGIQKLLTIFSFLIFISFFFVEMSEKLKKIIKTSNMQVHLTMNLSNLLKLNFCCYLAGLTHLVPNYICSSFKPMNCWTNDVQSQLNDQQPCKSIFIAYLTFPSSS